MVNATEGPNDDKPQQVFYGDEFHGTKIIDSNLGGTSGNNNIICNTPAGSVQAFKDDIVKDAGQDPNQEAMRKARIGRFQPQTTLKSQNSAGSAKSAK